MVLITNSPCRLENFFRIIYSSAVGVLAIKFIRNYTWSIRLASNRREVWPGSIEKLCQNFHFIYRNRKWCWMEMVINLILLVFFSVFFSFRFVIMPIKNISMCTPMYWYADIKFFFVIFWFLFKLVYNQFSKLYCVNRTILYIYK